VAGLLESKAHSDLRHIVEQSRYLWADHNIQESERIINLVTEWDKSNPAEIGFLCRLALGGEKSPVAGLYDVNPLLLKAIGALGNEDALPYLKERLAACIKRPCFFAKEVFATLLQFSSNGAVAVAAELLRKPKGNRLTYEFLTALEDNPKPEFFDVFLHLIRNGASYYKGEELLARFAQMHDVPFSDLLAEKSEFMLAAAVKALILLENDELLTSRVLETLRAIVKKKVHITKIRFVLIQKDAARLLMRRGIEVPWELRNHPLTKTTEDFERVLDRILRPGYTPDDWAQTEIANVRYEGDAFRIRFTHFFGPMINAEVMVWRGYFWDSFVMGFHVVRPSRLRSEYVVSGMCRAIEFHTKPFSIEYIRKNIDRILVAMTEQITERHGRGYQERIDECNHIISKGERPLLPMALARFWRVDWEKIEKQHKSSPT